MERTVTTIALGTAVLAAAAGGAAVGMAGQDAPAPDRRAQVAERGARVMPFDLDATTHRFIKRPDGGLQVVVADRPGDRRQVRLIEEHLREEARAFARGDFGDPASIHGAAMPGLAILRTAGPALSIAVQDRPDGAQLTYRTADPAVRDALHAWFDAQVSDHGRHAQGH